MKSTPPRSHRISGLKYQVLKGEKWSRIFYFEILLASRASRASPFRVAAAHCKKICTERLNWPGRLAGISEGASRILKEKVLDNFLPSFLFQKCWFQGPLHVL